MPLRPKAPSIHNSMLGRFFQPVRSKEKDDSTDSERSVKRVKLDDEQALPRSKAGVSPKKASRVFTTSDDEKEEDAELKEAAGDRRPDLENALPPISTDKEAIEEYETFRASQEAPNEGQNHQGANKWIRGKSSIYVDAFNLALDTVLEEESHLFDEPEKAVFEYWRQLEYEAQYLYVRLFLRKTAAWHRISNLGYHSDIGDLPNAIETLQTPRDLPQASSPPESYPGDTTKADTPELGVSFSFADKSEDYITSLEEASSLLRLDELKVIAKEVKVTGSNKKDLLKNLRKTSQRQAGLGFVGLRRSNTEDSAKSLDTTSEAETPESDLDHMNAASRDGYFTKKILDETGPYIRLSSDATKLFERVHLVFYRSSEWTEKSLTTIILAKIARRNFPSYLVSRSASVFASRSLLLEFEATLRTQFRIDNILEFNGQPSFEALQSILDTFEQVHPRWRELLEEEQRKEDTIYQSGEGAYLRRLSPAWVYTRIMHKAAYVLGLGKFKQHKREHEVLTELLDQRLFHSSRRGAWYQRKALLEEHYMGALTTTDGRSDEVQRKHWKRIALNTCENGLQDPLVHVIFHYDLQKRVRKLEKALKIAKRAQHDFSHVQLAVPTEVNIEGVRVERNRSMQSRRNSQASLEGARKSTRTVWLDPLSDNEECSVEEMCLSHYRSKGWKGYHSEGGILRTLFGYLFYDVIFTYVPNVFQTAYQTCPLDLHTDSFYPSRLPEINARLAQIENGEAETIIRQIWDEHADKKTCIVGLKWTFELDDLIEIVNCFNASALAVVCKVMSQEYAARGGGVPDLFLWHVEEKTVMFAEVKSENDRLSDTQRLWIHVLTGAGVKVELALAVASEVKVYS